MGTCGGQRLALVVFLDCISTLFVEGGSSLNMSLLFEAGMASQQAPRPSCLCLPEPDSRPAPPCPHHHAPSLYMDSGDPNQVLSFEVQQALHLLAIFYALPPSPLILSSPPPLHSPPSPSLFSPLSSTLLLPFLSLPFLLPLPSLLLMLPSNTSFCLDIAL